MKIALFIKYIKELVQLQKGAINWGVQTCRDPE